MALPWLRLLDVALGLADLARTRLRPAPGAPASTAEIEARPQTTGSPIEARLTGVVVAALKEAFDRDHQRLEFERDQRDAERRRAERLLRLELVRQAGDRELARLRWLAGIAVAAWLGTWLFAAMAGGASVAARVALGVGWGLLLAALATAMSAQARVSDALARVHDRDDQPAFPSGGGAGAAAPWLLVVGLAVIALAVLVR